jgi:hypothetical protein
MRFTVMGVWKVTGQPTTMSIEATDPEAASDMALRRGVQVERVEKARATAPHIGITKEEMEYAHYAVSSQTSIGKILFGLLLAGLGIGASWYSYNISQSHGTGHYAIWCGLILIGLWTAFRGAASNSANY